MTLPTRLNSMTLPRTLKSYKEIAEVYTAYDVGQAILELLQEVKRLRKEINNAH